MRVRRLLAAGLFVGSVASCASTRTAEPDPAFVAVHNALAATGLAQVGPIQRGSLSEGREARLRVDLGAQCTTLVALGGEGVVDLDLALIDPEGEIVARDGTRDPQATLRACVSTAGTYTLVVKMTRGAGSFVTGAWTGLGPQATPAGADLAAGQGTCENPAPLVARLTSGNTRKGDREHAGSCGSAESREIVYRFELARRQRVVLELDPDFDSILYVRKGDCGSPKAEVACNDDAPTGRSRHGQRASRIDQVFEPGTYYVFVDGYRDEVGAFRLAFSSSNVPTIAEACQLARPIGLGRARGTLTGGFDHARATCGQGAKGPDVPHRLDLTQRTRVRLTATSGDFEPVVHVRRQCVDERSAVACSDTGATDDEATVTSILDPAAYAVFVDATQDDATGEFTLALETAPPAGQAVPGDACADATPLAGPHAEVSGDTFFARDDVAGRCGGQGAADVVYRLELPRRTHLRASFDRQEGDHVFVLTRACGDASVEEACGPRIDALLPAGTHYLAVDGATADALGRFTFTYDLRDVGALDAACRTAPTLSPGQTVKGTTVGATDKMTTSCAGPEAGQASPDVIYKLTLAAPARVELKLETQGWDGVLALRRACAPPANGQAPRDPEVACNNDDDDMAHARIDAALDAGTYYVVVDGHAARSEGPFTLTYRVRR